MKTETTMTSIDLDGLVTADSREWDIETAARDLEEAGESYYDTIDTLTEGRNRLRVARDLITVELGEINICFGPDEWRDEVFVRGSGFDERILVECSEDQEPYDAAVRKIVGDADFVWIS